MTIEQKAKRYDEAVINGSRLWESGEITRESYEYIFPELAESKDERIRKVIYGWIYTQPSQFFDNGFSKEEMLAWIEKQGQKPTEPKFKIGDTIRRKEPRSFDKDMQVARIEKDYYVCNHVGKFSSEVVPFSKEDDYELVEQKPAWSEEDETGLTNTIIMLKEGASLHFTKKDIAKAVDWVKSIKYRVQPQPEQEWSEEDDRHLSSVIKRTIAYGDSSIHGLIKDDIDWLKSLKDRYTWKPSEEQLGVIEAVINNRSFQRRHLDSLYEQLKKLKG